jgi:hypothetical protein
MKIFAKFLLVVGTLALSCHGTKVWAVAKTVTAVGGGTWATATWAPVGVPGNADTCTINSGINLSIDTAAVCGSLDFGNATNATTTLTLAAGGSLNITSAGGQSGNLGFNPNGNILQTLTIAVGAQTMTVDGTYSGSGVSLVNTISVSTGQVNFTRAAGITWPARSTFTVTGNNAGGSLNCTGLFTLAAANAVLQNTTTAGTLNFNGGFTQTGGTFTTMAGEAINFGGNLTVSGGALTFNATSTETFTNTATITPTAAITFGHLTIDPGAAKTVTLAGAVTVAGNLAITTGALDDGNFQITGSAGTGILSMAANTSLFLGNVFPTNYTNARINLNVASTVTYNANAARTISSTPTYGNLTFAPSTLSNARTYTFAAGTTTINGDFNINPSGGARVLTVMMAGPVIVAAGKTTTIQASGTATGATLDAVGANNLTTGKLVVGNRGTFLGRTSTITLNATSGTLFTRNGATQGIFTPATSTVLVNPAADVTLNSGAITFSTLTIDMAGYKATLDAANNITIGTRLNLTNGRITTGTSNVIATAAVCSGTIVSRTNGWVDGNLQKAIPANASVCTFEVGGTSAYTPITATFIAGALASNITAKSTDGDHASIATSGLDPSFTANRSWSLTSTVAEATAFSAVFNFVPGDLDTDTQPATLFSGRTFSSGAWATPTTGTRAATSTQITGITLLAATQKDFVVGEAVRAAGTGSFNAVENMANATTGKIFTKLAGTAFTIDLVALNATRTAIDATFKGRVKIELLNSSSGGVLDANGCNAGWAIIQTLVANPQFLAADAGRKQNVSFAENKAWPNVRVRVSYPATGTATLIGCSSDNFSVRPTAFIITSTDATQTDSSGMPIIKTGANFNLTAASVAGYDGVPSIDNTKVVGTPTAGAIGGSFGAASAGTGTATGSSFFYSEVGNFGLNANAIYDNSYTSVDPPNTPNNDCTADFSNTLVGGKYGCSFGSTAVPLNVALKPSSGGTGSGFGRFIPDNFDVTFNTPIFGTTCGNFSYIGQRFIYTTAPVMTVTARNGTANGNATTVNYVAPYMKLTNATLTPNTTAGRYSRYDVLAPPVNNTPALDTSNMPAAGTDPVIAAATKSGVIIPGVYTLTFSSNNGSASPGLAFTRSATASNLFNADIALAVYVIDGDGVAYGNGTNPASFGAGPANNGMPIAGSGMAFSGGNGGKEMRYGRLRIANTYGSELLPLPVNITAQYWNGTQYLTNTADNCTSFAAANFAQAPPPTGPTITTTIQGSGTLLNGAGRITLTKPTGPVGPSGVIPKGSVDVSSTIPYLSPGLTGRETFGVYKSGPVIYMREMY